MPKIKVQIEADDEEFTTEDLENFLYELQQNLFENASENDASPWKVSIIGKGGALTPVAEPEDFEDEEEDDEEFYSDDEEEDEDY